MGTYINIGNSGFQRVRNSKYVDKTPMIAIINSILNTEQCMSCVTRCRRFGKSTAAKMLCAYYDQSCNSRHLFEDLKIANDPSFEQHLNKYPVIYLDLTSFVTRYKDDTIVAHINNDVIADVHAAYPDIPLRDTDDLMALLIRITEATSQPFFFIIDEWDAICREFNAGSKAMDDYVNWLRRMFKDSNSSKVFVGDDVIAMIGGGRCKVDPTGFQNDMSVIRSKDDVFTVLIHLGYLAYDWDTSECFIPNREVDGELVNAINYVKETKKHECRIVYYSCHQ